MQSNYYQIAQKFKRNKSLTLPESNSFHDNSQDQGFLKVFFNLKQKYNVIYDLFGEQNFKSIVFSYCQQCSYINIDHRDFGKNFSDFLGQLDYLAEYRYIKWLAKLDWFWFSEKESNNTITLPKGTLMSWANICKGSKDIEISIDESIIESLKIVCDNNEYKIISL